MSVQELLSTESTITPAPRKTVVIEKKLRVAYLTTEYPKTSHTFIRREISELEARGHEVVRLSIRPPSGPLVDPQDQAENDKTYAALQGSKLRLVLSAIKTFCLRPIALALAISTLWTLCKRSERGLLRHIAYLCEAAVLGARLNALSIPHVHVHFGTNAAAVALLMKKLFGIGYSITVHGSGEYDAPVGLSLDMKVAESAFTLVISHFGQAQLHRWVNPMHWNRIHVLRCTVAPAYLEEPPAGNPTANRLIAVGRLSAPKGHFLLLEAFARVVREGFDGHLVFAGDGELRKQLETRIRELNLESNITITGWLSETQVREQILSGRVLLLPSFAEGLPVVIMEAFALRRPALTTFVGGIPELVTNGETGWMIPAGDEDALVAGLKNALTAAPETLLSMGKAGRKKVLVQHNPHLEGEKLEAIFYRYLG
jgi:colanic acid/amylovoran biosynthesis glycosyltransferase